MYGFEWQDKRGVEGTGFVRALRSLLTAHLPEFRPKIEEIISNAVARELSKPEADGRCCPCCADPSAYRTARCHVCGLELHNVGELTVWSNG